MKINTFRLRSFWFWLLFLLLLLRSFLSIPISLALLSLLRIVNLDFLSCRLFGALQSTRTFLLGRSIFLHIVVVVHPRVAFLVFLVPVDTLFLSFSRFFLLLLPLGFLLFCLQAGNDMGSDSCIQDALLAMPALLYLWVIFEWSARGKGLFGGIVQLVDYRTRRCWNRARGWGICAFFFVVCRFAQCQQCAPVTYSRESIAQNIPSITLPSRQFPGLFCFGALFFNLRAFSLPSFFVGATLIVDSSSLPRDADKEGEGLASIYPFMLTWGLGIDCTFTCRTSSHRHKALS